MKLLVKIKVNVMYFYKKQDDLSHRLADGKQQQFDTKATAAEPFKISSVTSYQSRDLLDGRNQLI